MIKYLTTVDFGNVTYEEEFYKLLSENEILIKKSIRIERNYNIFLRLFKVYIVDCQI